MYMLYLHSDPRLRVAYVASISEDLPPDHDTFQRTDHNTGNTMLYSLANSVRVLLRLTEYIEHIVGS